MKERIKPTSDQATVIAAIIQEGGNPFYVGGIVRDSFMGKKSKDVDIEVFGVAADFLFAAIQECESVKVAKITGVDFPVIKVTCNDGTDMDVSLPRREVKAGMGRTGFIVEADPSMDMSEAAERRDFAMNAIMEHCQTGQVFDFFNGIENIETGVIRAIGPRFVESPDRMIRAGRFAAQFGFRVGRNVVAMCQAMAAAGEFATIKPEQLRAEFTKIAMSNAPSRAFRFFMEAGFGPFIPELHALIGCKQDPRWHPEGDVFEHTMLVVDEMVRVCEERGVSGEDRIVMIFGALCHDMGKPETTIMHEDGAITSAGHAAAGVKHAETFVKRMGFATASMIERVCKIVKHHMDGIGVTPNAKIVRRMASRMAPMTIAEFAMITEADASGRASGRFKPAAAFEAIAIQEACAEKPQASIIMGRHVVAAGVKAGPRVGQIVNACFEAQMDGVFTDIDGGMAFMHGIMRLSEGVHENK